MSHPIPAKGEVWFIGHRSDAAMDLDSCDYSNGHPAVPVLVLPCDERGETDLHRASDELSEIVDAINKWRPGTIHDLRGNAIDAIRDMISEIESRGDA